jgi:hypothetical protein
MATVTKDFKIKYGLVVEGSTATVNGNDVLTKSAGDTTYIQGLVGGVANSQSVANAIVLRDANASFAANVITADLVGDVTGQVSDISNFDTDDLGEGSTNLYFTNARAQAATAASYDAIGSAGAVAGDLSTHEGLTSAHGVTGDVVGTSDTQDLSNKRFIDTTYFTDGVTVSNEGQIAVLSPNHEFEIMANLGDLALKSYANNVVLTPGSGKSVMWGSDILATQDYADEAAANAVAAVVDSAPELLNTLNELANAIGDDANFAVTLANSVALKQNILTEGTGIDITGNTISVDTVTIATVEYVDDMETDDVAEGSTNLYFTNARAQAAVAGDISSAIDALDTDAIEEGSTNLYYTNTRAKGDAAELLTTATLTNITITGSGSGLTISAENGVADSDTDDLTEGTSNLYFSNARAVSALEAVVPNFTAVELASVAKQVAAQLSAPTAGIQVAHSFAKAEYRSAEYLVKVAYGAHTEISKVLLTLDTSDNIAITEYAIVGTNGSASTISASISGSDVRLNVTTANNSSTVTVVGTLVA